MFKFDFFCLGEGGRSVILCLVFVYFWLGVIECLIFCSRLKFVLEVKFWFFSCSVIVVMCLSVFNDDF